MDRRLGGIARRRHSRRMDRCSSTSAPSRPIRGRPSTSRRPCARTCGCRTPFTGSSRSPLKRRSRGARRRAPGRPRGRPLQADQQQAIPPRLPRIRVSLHAGAGTRRSHRQAIGVRYQDQSNVGRWQTAASGVRCRGNTWFIPYETIQNREKERPHPATFPPRLPEMCLRLHGLERIRSVADPFMGLGSTAVACAQLGLELHRDRDGRGLPEGGGRARARRPEVPSEPLNLSNPLNPCAQHMYAGPWICGSSRSFAPSQTAVPSPPPARSSTSRSPPSAARFCCSRKSSASRCSTASAAASASRRPASRCSS